VLLDENYSSAVIHLEKKYNEEFVGVGWHDTNVYKCYPVANEGWIAKVYFEREDGKRVIKDDYYGWLKKEEYLEITNSITRQWFPSENIKMYSNFSASYFKDEYTATTPLIEAMDRTPFNFLSSIRIFIAMDDGLDAVVFELKCMHIAELLREANYNTSIKVIAVQSDHLENINEDNYAQFFSMNKNIESGFLYEFHVGILDGGTGTEIVKF